MARNLLFILFNIVTLAVFYGPFKELAGLSFKSELYSHIVLIPIVSGYFFFSKRKELFAEAQHSYTFGSLLAFIGILLYFGSAHRDLGLNANDQLSIMVFSGVTFWAGGFLFFYGAQSFRIALFPVLFLYFLAPIPTRVVDTFIFMLQSASTEVTYVLFKLTGVPVLREGFVFHLPGMSIEVAKQCSGIRSSIALVITSIIAGQLFLRTGWRKVGLVLSSFPITVFKNGLRIVMLSVLGVYVDPRILGSELHRSGGIPFFLLALVFLAPVLWAFRRSEKIRFKVKGTREKVTPTVGGMRSEVGGNQKC